MTETHAPLPCPWKVGDKVQRKPGASYLFPGVIISVGLKLDGKTWHCEVECIAPGVEGCTHVFPASQLVPLDPAWNTRAVNSHHDLIEALRAVEAAMVRGGDGRILDTGWNITKLNEARPLIRAILTEEAGR